MFRKKPLIAHRGGQSPRARSGFLFFNALRIFAVLFGWKFRRGSSLAIMLSVFLILALCLIYFFNKFIRTVAQVYRPPVILTDNNYHLWLYYMKGKTSSLLEKGLVGIAIRLNLGFKCFAIRFFRVTCLLSSIAYDVDRGGIAVISSCPKLA